MLWGLLSTPAPPPTPPNTLLQQRYMGDIPLGRAAGTAFPLPAVHQDTTHISPLPENPPLWLQTLINGPSRPAVAPPLERIWKAASLHCFPVLLKEARAAGGAAWLGSAGAITCCSQGGFSWSYQCFGALFSPSDVDFFRGLPWCLPGLCSLL